MNDDLSTLSLVSIIVFIYSLGKKFYCTNLKTTEQEMILPCIKSFNEKIHEKTKHASDFSTLSIDDMKTKNTNLFCWYKNTQQ